MNKLLRGTVVRRLKIKDFLEGGGYNKWLDVDEGSLQFYRAGKQARFRFTVSGITIDGPMVRIVGMGYDYDGIDESLFYWSFPNIGALNTPEGARKALRVVRAFDIDLVVVDTISKFITGPEKEADTWNQLYQHFLTPLKEEGVASVLADHPGYGDADRGRGSSSKGGDVDTLWTLKKAKGQKTIGVTDLVLKQQWDRAAGDRVLYVRRTSDPLSHEISLSAPSNGPQRTTQAADGEVSATGLLAANFTEPVGINAGTRYLRAAGVRGSQDNLTAIVRQFNDKLIGAK